MHWDEPSTGALFPTWTSTVFRVVLAAIPISIATISGLGLAYVRSPLFTGENEPVSQPLEFDHRHHVGDAGIDCLYCHSSVDRAPSAGYPSTETCLNCHNQVWNRSPLLDGVRQSYFENRSLEWKRVHDLPDHVYFDHSIHLRKGVGCVTCHGRVDQMPEIMRKVPLTMGFCLECHRDPVKHLRPREHLTDLDWQPDDALTVGRAVAAANRVHTRTSCTTCHR
jgi:hypothetical protein